MVDLDKLCLELDIVIQPDRTINRHGDDNRGFRTSTIRRGSYCSFRIRRQQ